MSLLALFVLILSSLCIKISFCDPRASEAALICTNRTALASDREPFISTFLSALDSLTRFVSSQRYGAVINGTGNNTVYGYGECMKDLSQNDCNLCFAQSKTQILRCLPFQRLIRGGRLFFDGCYIRYDDYEFFDEGLSSVDRTVCGVRDFGGDQALFRASVLELVGNISLQGPKNDGFYAGSVSRGTLNVYGLGQCWETVNGSVCEKCLADSASKIGSCLVKEEGRVLNAGCYLRYSTQKFYYNTSDSNLPAENGERSHHLATTLAAVSGVVAFLLVAATICFIVRKRIMKQRREEKQLGTLLNTVRESKLNFSYEILEKATDYFDKSNKLGQGGSGCVYKGILPDGQVVAVKRLSFNTAQWVDHFFNEVNLISGIHHKNLVRLLGCSITGPESLLVYEYVPNHCLHDYLFGRKIRRPLVWEERFKVIFGTAQGLAHLHEESSLRIIHRDIKLSNILLDEDFTPKIADFGLARLFPEDQTHISTAIAGTLGYMAPEYVVRGKLTEKVDIYGFGVLVIEVVSGQKNYAFTEHSYSILQKIWNLYGSGNLCEAVDPSLEGRFQEEMAARILQIGLLCVQAAAESRPTMSEVVKMLTEKDHKIPQPTQPPFLSCVSAVFTKYEPPGTNLSSTDSHKSSENNMTESWIGPR